MCDVGEVIGKSNCGVDVGWRMFGAYVQDPFYARRERTGGGGGGGPHAFERRLACALDSVVGADLCVVVTATAPRGGGVPGQVDDPERVDSGASVVRPQGYCGLLALRPR